MGDSKTSVFCNHTESRDVFHRAIDSLSANSAEPALPVPVTVMDENAFLASIEAGLTEEMWGLALTLAEFARVTKAICVEISKGAKFCKLVAASFSMAAFKFSDAILCRPQVFTFEDNGALYFKQLCLKLQDFVRELNFEGGKLFAIALLHKRGRDVLDGFPNRDEL